MAESMLQITGLVSSYGNIKALKGISMEINRGEIVSLLGANGAGKSTLMKSILGMVTIEGEASGSGTRSLWEKRAMKSCPWAFPWFPKGGRSSWI